MNFGLNESTIEKFHSVFMKYPEIEEVIIYGSRAKGNFREGSDIDITLKGNNITDEMYSKIWLDIDDLNSPYLVDLSVFHSIASMTLKEHIQLIGKTFYKA
jgi:uncharacterized protein